MTTATKTDPRARITARLKKFVAEFDALQSRAHSIKAHIFADTYQWVTYAIQMGKAKDVKAGCVALGNTIKRGFKNVESWFYCGQFMVDQKLDPNKVDARSVRAIYNRRRALSPYHLRKTVDMTRKREPHREVMAVVMRSASANVAGATRKAVMLANKNQLTPARLKMEALALATLAHNLYGETVTITIKPKTKKAITVHG